MIRLSAREYVGWMQRAGLFSESASHPEHNTRVWQEHWRLTADHIGAAPLAEVLLLADRYGFYRDPEEAERTGMNWALTAPIVDPVIPAARERFLADLPLLRQRCASWDEGLIVSDTFRTPDGYIGQEAEGLVYLHSPVAALSSRFGDYLDSLSSKRRKKYRQLARALEPAGLRFELSERPLSEQELCLARDRLTRRFGPVDMPYALAQSLWATAVGTVLQGTALFMRVYKRDHLVFVQTLIRRGGRVYAQSIFKSEDDPYDGIGPYTDFKTIELLCGGRDDSFDPSCRTGLQDPESIGIAKRATVNHDLRKPLLVLGKGWEQAVAAGTLGQPA